MDLSEIRSVLQQLKPELTQKYFVQTIGLFGSFVCEDFSASSDVDILVEFNQPIGIEFVDLANYIEAKLNRKVDLVSRNGIKQKYYEAIEKEILYV